MVGTPGLRAYVFIGVGVNRCIYKHNGKYTHADRKERMGIIITVSDNVLYFNILAVLRQSDAFFA